MTDTQLQVDRQMLDAYKQLTKDTNVAKHMCVSKDRQVATDIDSYRQTGKHTDRQAAREASIYRCQGTNRQVAVGKRELDKSDRHLQTVRQTARLTDIHTS